MIFLLSSTFAIEPLRQLPSCLTAPATHIPLASARKCVSPSATPCLDAAAPPGHPACVLLRMTAPIPSGQGHLLVRIWTISSSLGSACLTFHHPRKREWGDPTWDLRAFLCIEPKHGLMTFALPQKFASILQTSLGPAVATMSKGSLAACLGGPAAQRHLSAVCVTSPWQLACHLHYRMRCYFYLLWHGACRDILPHCRAVAAIGQHR